MFKRLFSRGSVLIYTLFILIMLLVSGLALSTVVLLQQRGSATAGNSLNAFQSANDGFEDLMARYKRASGDTLSALTGQGATCDGGTITVASGVRPYTATFTKESEGVQVSVGTCDEKLSEISQVKVVATVGSSTRAIETAFAAGMIQCERKATNWQNLTNHATYSTSCSNGYIGITCIFDYYDTNGTTYHGFSLANFTPDRKGCSITINDVGMTEGRVSMECCKI